MKRTLNIILLLMIIGITAVALGVFDQGIDEASLPRAKPMPITLAERDEALTFAWANEAPYLVIGFDGEDVTAISLAALKEDPADDPVALINRLGYDALKAFADAAVETVPLPLHALAVPVNLRGRHIAAGTNYRDHAEEATVESGPFLFPKYVAPTGHNADIPIPLAGSLLDYEVELCLVTLQPLDPLAGAHGGLILCNDVTDRATLLRGINADDPGSGDGFTAGKSAPGFLPVGSFFVVPRDLKGFAESLELHLAINGKVRQRSVVKLWIWDFDRVLSEAYAKRDYGWSYGLAPGTSQLPFDENGHVPARTLILSGTPGGTVFQGIYPSAYVRGVMQWIGAGFSGSVVDHAKEAHIGRAQELGDYLQAGDLVTIWVDKMGVMSNRVVQ